MLSLVDCGQVKKRLFFFNSATEPRPGSGWTLAALGSAMSGPRHSFPWLEHSPAVAATGQVGNEYCRAVGHVQSELPVPGTRFGEASIGANRCSCEELSSGGWGVPFFHTHKKCPFPLPAGKSELTTAFPFEMEKRNKNMAPGFGSD